MKKLEILFEDDHYVAINKPAGLLVHKTKLAKADHYAVQLLRDQLKQHVYPIHRLDRPTCGVLLFAKSAELVEPIAAQFRENRVTKQYLTIARGYTADRGLIEHTLFDEEKKSQQEAVTEYEKLHQIELPISVGRYSTSRYSLVLVTPKTGRRHQIRKHFAHIFHPIIGDTTHGEGRHNRMFRERLGIDGLLLLSRKLSFTHPVTGEKITIQANPDSRFRALCRHFNWNLSAL